MEERAHKFNPNLQKINFKKVTKTNNEPKEHPIFRSTQNGKNENLRIAPYVLYISVKRVSLKTSRRGSHLRFPNVYIS
ncbi:hypothetical protein POVCU2_0071200 [Plasmodium ovale curtisi]|uniref:Uncharacterized protein n=1 Tax=Plasmodium ovale curtisi TaxID=864141 RepID=A0A1A8WJH7_PLAOA|nr:hypothetical protein POVCU2_0071200 [Plasmodium ovale curtisi]